VGKLEAALVTVKTELKKEEVAHKALIKLLRTREPLFKVGVATRRRFLEHCKRARHNGQWVGLFGEVDMAIIEAGNEAAHRGDIAADAAMFTLKVINNQDYKEPFQKIYHTKYAAGYGGALLSQKATRILNWRGTLAGCFSFTDYTLSSGLDKQFLGLWHKNRKTRHTMLESGTSAETIIRFDRDEEVAKDLLAMEAIVDEVVLLHKRRGQS